MESEKNNNSIFRHWPTLALGVAVAVVFILAIFSFQVNSTEYAVVTRLGRVMGVKGPGLHFRLPPGIDVINRFDNRLYCFDGNVGKIEETYTSDGKNIIAGIFTVYRISDPVKLFKSVKTVEQAEDKLNSHMRTQKNGVIGKYKFEELVNTDPKKMKIGDIEREMKENLAAVASEQFGITIESVGIKTLEVPEKISERVFERMKEERNVLAEKYRSEGKNAAKKIRDEADSSRKLKLADAEAQAKQIKAEGDATAASYYAVFRENPELAAFLRKLESLRKIMPNKTTLILNTDYVPFDLLKPDSGFLKLPDNFELQPVDPKKENKK